MECTKQTQSDFDFLHAKLDELDAESVGVCECKYRDMQRLYIYVSVYLSIYLSVCLSLYQSMYLYMRKALCVCLCGWVSDSVGPSRGSPAGYGKTCVSNGECVTPKLCLMCARVRARARALLCILHSLKNIFQRVAGGRRARSPAWRAG